MPEKKNSARRSAEDIRRRAEEAGRTIHVIKRGTPKSGEKKSK